MNRRDLLGRGAYVAATAIGASTLAQWQKREQRLPIPRVYPGSPMNAKDHNALIDRVNELTAELDVLREARS